MAAIEQSRQAHTRSALGAPRILAVALLTLLSSALVVATVTFVDRTVAVSLVAAASVSLLAGLLTSFRPRRTGLLPNVRSHAYTRRLDELTAALRRPSKELDRLLDELTGVTAERQSAIEALTDQLAGLALQERELRQRNAELRNVSIPAVEIFAAMNAEGERRSERRDYRIFAMGVVVSLASMMLGFVLQGI